MPHQMSISLLGCPAYIGIKFANWMPKMRGKNLFKKTDMRRAIDTARRAGLTVEHVEVTKDGTIRLATKDGTNSRSVPIDNENANPWDEVNAANEERSA